MNRVVVWVLGVISGVLLFFSVMSLTLGAGGYGASSSCSSPGPDPAPCTPTLQQVYVGESLRWDGPLSAILIFLLLAILIGLPAWIGSPILAQRRGSSSRAAILIVSIIASAFLIVSVVSLFISPAFATPETCLASSDPQICFYGAQATLVAALGIGLPLLLMSLLIGMPAWVMALTETARHRRWRWFVVVLLFSPIAAMLYGFLGGRQQPPPVAAPSIAASGA